MNDQKTVTLPFVQHQELIEKVEIYNKLINDKYASINIIHRGYGQIHLIVFNELEVVATLKELNIRAEKLNDESYKLERQLDDLTTKYLKLFAITQKWWYKLFIKF